MKHSKKAEGHISQNIVSITKDEVNCPNILRDKNYQASSHIYRQIITQLFVKTSFKNPFANNVSLRLFIEY